MQIVEELPKMAQRAFSDELMKILICAFQQELADCNYEIVEQDYAEGNQVLDATLDESSKNKLLKMEDLIKQNIFFGMQFAFNRGEYTGFQQFFVQNTTEHPFNDFIQKGILTMPKMQL